MHVGDIVGMEEEEGEVKPRKLVLGVKSTQGGYEGAGARTMMRRRTEYSEW